MQLKDRYGRSAKMEQFLQKHNMHPMFINMKEVLTKFRHHMNLGLAGQSSSLLMIPTYVRVPKQLFRNRKVLAMDAGGTNLRSATVWFMDNGDPMIEDFSKSPMPASDGQQLSKREFYRRLGASVAAKTQEHAHLGICFSYPISSTPECDGRVLFFSKEINAPEVVGTYVGHSLKEAIKELEPQSQLARVLVVNDTVTTLLSGLLHSDSKHFSSYIGFILGTGMNIAYVAPNASITKLKDVDERGHQVVNLEAGGFNALLRGTFDRMLDQETASPGTFFMEKMMSGAYFGRLVAITLEHACDAGLFEEDSANRLRPILHELDTATVCDFYNNIHHDDNLLSLIFSEVALSQKELAGQIIAHLVQRMAKIIAAALSATILHSGEGFLPHAPVCITIDGTTYYAFNGLADEVKRLMREEILVGAYKRYFTTVSVENASLLGAAIATYAF